MSEIVMRKDKNLTMAVKNIFGDIVDSAYVTTWNIRSSRLEISERIKNEFYESAEDEIDIGGKNIIISFKNGKSVYFTNSEWGSMSAIDLSKVEEI